MNSTQMDGLQVDVDLGYCTNSEEAWIWACICLWIALSSSLFLGVPW